MEIMKILYISKHTYSQLNDLNIDKIEFLCKSYTRKTANQFCMDCHEVYEANHLEVYEIQHIIGAVQAYIQNNSFEWK